MHRSPSTTGLSPSVESAPVLFENSPFRLQPVLEIVAVLIAALAVELMGELLDLLSYLC